MKVYDEEVKTELGHFQADGIVFTCNIAAFLGVETEVFQPSASYQDPVELDVEEPVEEQIQEEIQPVEEQEIQPVIQEAIQPAMYQADHEPELNSIATIPSQVYLFDQIVENKIIKIIQNNQNK